MEETVVTETTIANALQAFADAIVRLEARLLSLERIVAAQNRLIGQLGEVAHGHQRGLEALSALAGIEAPKVTPPSLVN